MRRAALLIFLLCATSCRPHGPRPKAAVRVVTGLSHVVVVAKVLPKDPTTGETGHTAFEKALEKDVALQLEQSGVSSFTFENQPAERVPLLWVNVDTLKVDHQPVDEYLVSVFVTLVEWVTLGREPKTEVPAETWRSTVSMAVTDPDHLSTTVRAHVHDRVAEFTDLYLSAHPGAKGPTS